MMSVDLIVTGVILTAAVAWAGRRLWRSGRAVVDPDPEQPVCGGGCTNCPMSETPTDIALKPPDDLPSK